MQDKDSILREEIVFGHLVDWGKALGGIEYFDELSGEKLQELLDKKLIDPEDRQNNSPTNQEFLEFMKKYPEVKAHGYMVGGTRDDARVSIEGLGCLIDMPADYLLKDDFIKEFHSADEFLADQNELYCWYD